MTDTNEELASLRRQLKEARGNLRLIRERKSQFVMGVEIPLQIIKGERRLEQEIAGLEREIADLEATDVEVAEEQEPATAPLSRQTEHRYDVFISYSRTDQEWVRGELLPRLEKADLKVILDYRDFEPGAPLLTEMERAVQESRKTILVLTPAYLDSEWAEFENVLAQTLDPGARLRRVIPVMLRSCERPLRIRSLVCVDLRTSQPSQFQRLLRALTGEISPSPEIDIPTTLSIPAGLFLMGSCLDDSAAHENEQPRRKVDLRGYRIGRYPVTNAQYAHFVHETEHHPPEHWDDGEIPDGLEDHPVVNVDHEDAEAYCRWLRQITGEHYRLPTEEEWEKAARGGYPEERCYPWGDEWQEGICNTEELGREGTTSVHEFEHVNRSPFEVVDMVGNVWEWTDSWYERYPNSPHQSLHYGRICRVVRGGSWRNSKQEIRISCRGRYNPPIRRPYLGFRVALDADITQPVNTIM